jgi:hypothetical protein
MKERSGELVAARPRVKRALIIFAVVFVGLALAYWVDWGVSGVKQPIEFPHKTHIAQKIPCTGCHQRAEKDLVAGRPPTALCLACHASGDSKSAEISKLKAYGDKGQDIPWQRVWRLPSHVFFSHRVHVTVAKLACQSCHGPMETLDRPPPRPLKTLAMEDCIACHTKSKANTVRESNAARSVNVSVQRLANDCVGCHR